MTEATPLQAIETEAAAPADGLLVTLTTEFGSAQILVPPTRKWRSRARHAIITTGDDMLWAKLTLAPEDLAEWQRLDPNAEESEDFFERVMAGNGESLGKSGASRASSKNTRKR